MGQHEWTWKRDSKPSYELTFEYLRTRLWDEFKDNQIAKDSTQIIKYFPIIKIIHKW